MDLKLRFRITDDERPFISEANNYTSVEAVGKKTLGRDLILWFVEKSSEKLCGRR